MAPPELRPIFYPPDAKRPFTAEEVVQRIARVARWGNGARVLHLGCATPAPLALAKVGCSVVAVDPDTAAVERLQERARAQKLTDRLSARVGVFAKLTFSEGEFEGIFVESVLETELGELAKTLRRLLAAKGRLCLTYPVRVGRHQGAASMELWKKRLGQALVLPQQALQAMEAQGYEPQSVETLPDAEVDEHYRSLEAALKQVGPDDALAQAARDELRAHQDGGPQGSVSFACVIARRKDPGEKPPPSRSDG